MAFPCRDIYTVRWYRLSKPVPLVVAFPSVTYVVEISLLDPPEQWQLVARASQPRMEWSIHHVGKCRAQLELQIYRRGFDVAHPTAVSTILERLVRDGAAEHIPRPPPFATAGAPPAPA